MASPPLLFGSVLAGGIIIQYGTKSLHRAFTAAQSSASANSTGSGSGGAPTPNSAGYVNPLAHASSWGRTDQGVDGSMPVGAPIMAPGKIKIMGIIPNWFAGQPLIWWQLLDGPDAGKYQYVAEQIDNLARPGAVLQQGATIATFAPSGTGFEFGWATASGATLARATTGYTEGQITQAGREIIAWLDSFGMHLQAHS